jgi:hypothetical protein
MVSVPEARPLTPRKFTATSRKASAVIVPLALPEADAAPILPLRNVGRRR